MSFSDVPCLIWDVSPIALTIGGVSIRWYGLYFAAGLVLGTLLVARQFARTAHHPDTPWRLLQWAFVGMLVGAWLGHRLFYEWDLVRTHPLLLIDIRPIFHGGVAGLSSHGAAVGVLLAIALFSRRYGIPFLEVMDRAVFGVAVVAAFVRLGNFMNSEIVGLPTHLPWAVCYLRYDGANSMIPRHPVQLYEFLMGLIVLAVLVWVDRRAGGEKRPLGLMTATFGIAYFGLRYLVEIFKQPLVVSPEAVAHGALTMGQRLSIPFMLAGLAILIWIRNHPRPASSRPQPPAAAPQAAPRSLPPRGKKRRPRRPPRRK